jgi:maltooligosyltrehalose synthase
MPPSFDIDWRPVNPDLENKVLLPCLADQLGEGRRPAPAWPLYVVAEKILCEGEPLPQDLAIDGTTGYDFLNAVNGLFVDGDGRDAFNRAYQQFVRPAGPPQRPVGTAGGVAGRPGPLVPDQLPQEGGGR